jgi:hypothetical protein
MWISMTHTAEEIKLLPLLSKCLFIASWITVVGSAYPGKQRQQCLLPGNQECKVVWGVPTINTQLQMVCSFTDTHCTSNYTTCIMRSLRRSTVDCDGRATCSWSRLTGLLFCNTAGSVAVLRLVRWGVMFSEDRWSQEVSWSGWFPFEAREWVNPAGLVEGAYFSPTCSCRWLHCDIQNVPRELHCWKSTF